MSQLRNNIRKMNTGRRAWKQEAAKGSKPPNIKGKGNGKAKGDGKDKSKSKGEGKRKGKSESQGEGKGKGKDRGKDKGKGKNNGSINGKGFKPCQNTMKNWSVQSKFSVELKDIQDQN